MPHPPHEDADEVDNPHPPSFVDEVDVGVSRQQARRAGRTTRQDHDEFDDDFEESAGVLDERLYVPRPEVVSTRTTHTTRKSSHQPRKAMRSSRTVGHRPEFIQYHEERDDHRYPRTSREILSDFDTFHKSREPYFSGGVDMKKPPGGKKMLKKVQHELEAQRDVWADEINEMLVNPVKSQGKPQGSNSYVDTKSGKPIFKAFVDVKDFPPECISISVDNTQNKVVVRAEVKTGGTLKRTFTQKVQLPRYADETNVRSFMSKSGMLKLEVPLLFYFDPPQAFRAEGRQAGKVFRQRGQNEARWPAVPGDTGQHRK